MRLIKLQQSRSAKCFNDFCSCFRLFAFSVFSSTCWFRLYTSRRSYKAGCCTHQFPAHSLCRCIPEHSCTCSYSRGQHTSRRFCRVAVHTRWCLVRISVQCNLACKDTGTRRVCRHMSLRSDMGCWNIRLSQFHSLFLEILRAVKWKVEHHEICYKFQCNFTLPLWPVSRLFITLEREEREREEKPGLSLVISSLFNHIENIFLLFSSFSFSFVSH